MKKTLTNIEEGNMPTTVQMKLLHWLTQLELSGGASGDLADMPRLSVVGSLKGRYREIQEIKI
jgi:hypothetical protein